MTFDTNPSHNPSRNRLLPIAANVLQVVVRAPELARQGAAAEVPPLRPRVVDAHVDMHDVLVVGVVLLLEEERWAVEEVGGQRFCRDV